MPHSDSLMVFTFKSVERMLADGGTSSWRLNRSEVLKRRFAICTRNRFDKRSEGVEPHGSAFLIGRIADVVPAPGRDKRWLVTFSEYAHLDLPDVWSGDRNPVRYTSIDSLGIDLDALTFLPMPDRENPLPAAQDMRATLSDEDEPRALSVAEAKAGLAITFGVSPEAIEIVVRA